MVLVMIVWRSIVFVTGCDIAGTNYVGCVVWLPGDIGWGVVGLLLLACCVGTWVRFCLWLDVVFGVGCLVCCIWCGSLVTVGFGGFARCLRGLVSLVVVCFIDCCD